MHVPRDARFDEDAERFALRFCCDHCGFWNAAAERCRHGWPTAEHRAARYRTVEKAEGPAAGDAPGEVAPAVEAATTVVFCKEFELR